MNEFFNAYGYRLKSTDMFAMKDTTVLKTSDTKDITDLKTSDMKDITDLKTSDMKDITDFKDIRHERHN